ncbi:unnamed protein product, partial [Amoebophrya sp. A120]
RHQVASGPHREEAAAILSALVDRNGVHVVDKDPIPAPARGEEGRDSDKNPKGRLQHALTVRTLGGRPLLRAVVEDQEMFGGGDADHVEEHIDVRVSPRGQKNERASMSNVIADRDDYGDRLTNETSSRNEEEDPYAGSTAAVDALKRECLAKIQGDDRDGRRSLPAEDHQSGTKGAKAACFAIADRDENAAGSKKCSSTTRTVMHEPSTSSSRVRLVATSGQEVLCDQDLGREMLNSSHRLFVSQSPTVESAEDVMSSAKELELLAVYERLPFRLVLLETAHTFALRHHQHRQRDTRMVFDLPTRRPPVEFTSDLGFVRSKRAYRIERLTFSRLLQHAGF